MTMHEQHQPVLLEAAVRGLNIKPDGFYVDATFGRGGHSRAILDCLGPSGRLLAIDRDWEAIKFAKETVQDERFNILQGSFATMAELIAKQAWRQPVDGILFDLGVSSPQLDVAERGFSFLRDGPLDMRMDQQQGVSAKDWIASVKEASLASILREYGEERFAKRIAGAICSARTETPIETTKQLADIVKAAHPAWEKKKHPATRSFQAIRIFINAELDDLSTALDASLEVLRVGGRLAVISFHSLEDRKVKHFIQEQERGGDFPARLPVKQSDFHPRLKRVGSAGKASMDEINNNPRARSARLRIAEKVA